MIAEAQERETMRMAPGDGPEHCIAGSPEVPGIAGISTVTTAQQTRRMPSQRRDEIIAKVAHELRTPLSSILMTTGFVLDELLPPDAGTAIRLHLESIRRATRLMARLVEDLLEGSTLQPGGLTLMRTPIRVADLFMCAEMLLQPIAAARDMALTFTIDERLSVFWVDEARLIQVIANLVSNAIKFSERGGTISVDAVAGPREIAFRVVDCGAGIAPDDLAHVFDRFWQAPGTRHLGVGLGLAIAREIVEAHGGRIEVRSVVGAGTVFDFTIPL